MGFEVLRTEKAAPSLPYGEGTHWGQRCDREKVSATVDRQGLRKAIP